LRDALARMWWLYPVAMILLSLGPMIFAFRAARDQRDDDPQLQLLERTAFAFLANVLLDTAIFVVAAMMLFLLSRDP
jgi:hypothetical protein